MDISNLKKIYSDLGYDDVTISTAQNGTTRVIVKDAKGNTIGTDYIPSGAFSTEVQYTPGSGGSSNDFNNDDLYMGTRKGEESYQLQSIVCVESSGTKEIASAAAERGNKVAEALGYSIDKLCVTSYSHSGDEGALTAIKFAEEHPDVQVSLAAIDATGVTSEMVDSIKNNNIAVLVVDGDSYHGAMKVFEQQGVTLFHLDPQKRGHEATDDVFQEEEVYNFLLGLDDDSISYAKEFYVMNQETGKLEKVTKEEFINKYKEITKITYRDTTLATGLTNGEYNKDDGSFAADLYQIYDSMDQLKKTITGYSPTNATATVSESNSGVATELVTIQNNFLGIGQGISSNISKEADLIQDMANLIYQMDEDLTNKASELSDLENTRIANTIDAAMSTILDDTVTYTESYLTSNLTTGKVGSINQDELFDLITAAKTNLETDKSNAEATKKQIESFQSILNGSSFQGTAWDKVTEKLSDYDELLQKRIESSEKLSEAYQTAYDKIIDYMNDSEFSDGYITLDDSLIPEVQKTISDLTKEIAECDAKLAETITYTDETGDHRQYKYLGKPRDAIEKQKEAAELSKDEAEEYLKKLEGFAPFLNTVLKELNDTLQGIYGDYGKKAKEVFPGKSTEYTKVDDTDTDKSDTTKTKTTTRNGGGGGGGGGGSNSQDDTSDSSTEYTGETVVDSDSLLDGTTLETTEETTEEVVATPVNYDNNAYNYSDSSTNETIDNTDTEIDSELDYLEELEEIEDDSFLDDDLYDDDLMDISNDDDPSTTIVEETTTETTKKSSGLKTAGKVIGLGAALGAAGYGGYTIYKKHKENDDTE